MPDLPPARRSAYHYILSDIAFREAYGSARHDGPMTESAAKVPGDEGALDHVMYIRYEDVYSRDHGGTWKIDRRDVRTDWTETREVRDALERS
jgi:hypothetical protein